MKKNSFLLSLVLIIVLVFAVSCPTPEPTPEPEPEPTPTPTKEVEPEVGGDALTFTAGDAASKTGTITLKGGTFVNTNDFTNSMPNSGAGLGHIIFDYAIDDTNKAVLKVTVKSTTAVATTDGGIYKINIPKSAIAADEDYTAKDLSVSLTITVNPVSTPDPDPSPTEPTQIDAPTISPRVITYTVGTGFDNAELIISLENATFIENKIEYKIDGSGTFDFEWPNDSQAGACSLNFFKGDTANTVKVQIEAGSDPLSNEWGIWKIIIKKDAIQPNANYKNDAESFELSFELKQG